MTNDELITLCISLVRLKKTSMYSMANKGFSYFCNILVERHHAKKQELYANHILKLRGEQMKGEFDSKELSDLFHNTFVNLKTDISSK
jgi:hypothetical protein